MKIIASRNGNLLDEYDIPVYEVNGLFKTMTETAMKDPKYEQIFKEKYEGKMSVFSPYMAFCLNELNVDIGIKDPFCENHDEIMFADGYKTYIAPTNYVLDSNFKRRKAGSTKKGIPILTDNVIGFDSEPEDLSNGIKCGIVDEKGFVSSDVMHNFYQFAQVYLLNILISDKSACETFELEYNKYDHNNANMSPQAKKYHNIVDFLVHGLHRTCILKNKNNEFKVLYDEETCGKPMDIVIACEELNKSNSAKSRAM